MERFGDKVALVTGSTQGLGQAIAERFVSEGLAGLVVTGRNSERGKEVSKQLASGGCRTDLCPGGSWRARCA